MNPAPPSIAFADLQRPFTGARLAVDPQTQAAKWQRANDAGWLDPITTQPQARWLNGFADLDDVPSLVAAAKRQGALPVLVAYAIPNRGCSNFREGLPYGDYDRPTPRADSYAAWIAELVRRLGRPGRWWCWNPMPSRPTASTTPARATLRGAVDELVAAKQYVYIDAGHSSWVPSGEVAMRLLRSGVEKAEGVSLNVSNRYPTWAAADFGEELSELVGGRDYIVDSSRNGADDTELDPASLSNDWCNRPDQALGVQKIGTPDAARWPHLAAQLWIKVPGESDGNATVFPQQDCHGETAAPGTSPRARPESSSSTTPPSPSRCSARSVRRPCPSDDRRADRSKGASGTGAGQSR